MEMGFGDVPQKESSRESGQGDALSIVPRGAGCNPLGGLRPEPELIVQGSCPAQAGDGVVAGTARDPLQPSEFTAGGVAEGLGEVVGVEPAHPIKQPPQFLGVDAIHLQETSGTFSCHHHLPHITQGVDRLAELDEGQFSRRRASRLLGLDAA